VGEEVARQGYGRLAALTGLAVLALRGGPLSDGAASVSGPSARALLLLLLLLLLGLPMRQGAPPPPHETASHPLPLPRLRCVVLFAGLAPPPPPHAQPLLGGLPLLRDLSLSGHVGITDKLLRRHALNLLGLTALDLRDTSVTGARGRACCGCACTCSCSQAADVHQAGTSAVRARARGCWRAHQPRARTTHTHNTHTRRGPGGGHAARQPAPPGAQALPRRRPGP
jgi:hypothetical protein